VSISIAAYEAMIERFADCQTDLAAERARADARDASWAEEVRLYKSEAQAWKAVSDRLRAAVEKVQAIAGCDIRSVREYSASMVQIIGVTRAALGDAT
jgi:hypothetical protein